MISRHLIYSLYISFYIMMVYQICVCICIWYQYMCQIIIFFWLFWVITDLCVLHRVLSINSLKYWILLFIDSGTICHCCPLILVLNLGWTLDSSGKIFKNIKKTAAQSELSENLWSATSKSLGLRSRHQWLLKLSR